MVRVILKTKAYTIATDVNSERDLILLRKTIEEMKNLVSLIPIVLLEEEKEEKRK